MDAHWFKKEISGYKKSIGDLDTKVKEQHKMLNSSLLVFKDIDSQVQTLKEFLIASGMFTELEYDQRVDARRGLQLLKAEDEIKVGDIVWVDYIAYIGGDKVGEDAGLPLRIGSGAINFELALVGHKIGETVKAEHLIQEEGEWKGKQVDFTIIINKAKTKILGEDHATGNADGGLHSESNTDISAQSDIGGHAVEEQHTSNDSDILGRPSDAGQGSLEPSIEGVEGLGHGGLGHSNASNDLPQEGQLI